MNIRFPSAEFEDAVAAVCHGSASENQMRALNELLRSDAAARDGYILRVELHSRLASDSELFASAVTDDSAAAEKARAALLPPAFPPATVRRPAGARIFWGMAIAAAVALVATGTWLAWPPPEQTRVVATSRAVAMLQETVHARWAMGESPRPGAPLEPGWLKLEAGLAQVVFYSGARLVIEGPAELRLVSANHAVCLRGKITAEVPPQARGFRVDTPQGTVTDLGTTFGIEVNERAAAVHVFKGEVTVQATSAHTADNLREGSGAVIETLGNTQRNIVADPRAFASLFELHAMSSAAEAQRLVQWRAAGERLNRDPALITRFDFDGAELSRWQVRNVSAQAGADANATVVGCQWGEGRWPGKHALEFQGVSDRVRLSVPGQSDSVTLAAWVRVRGLDRKLNSLFMSDGFAAGTVHWLIRNDGVLGVTIVGDRPGSYQIAASPPILTLDRFGAWVHLAVVVDGREGRIIHFVNGCPVSEESLRIKPPYRIGTGELGNWHAKGYPKDDPFMIRNFSGAIDEFCLFLRPLDAREIADLYAEGRPDAEILPLRQ
jgi:hypothetical protein